VSDQGPAGEPELNAAAIAAALNRYQVRYVIIGAFAAIAQQALIPATRDIDLTPEASQENLTRLWLGETEVVVADLADVIRSKESAGRPKDLRVLPLLYRHQSTRGSGAKG